MPFDNYTNDDFQAFAEEMNRPQLQEKLDKAVQAAEEAYSLIMQAKRNNPRGLIF